MNDEFVQTEHQGYFSRVIKSFTGVLFGLLLIPGSVCLLGWNEYRTVHRSRGIDEAEKVCAEVPSIAQVSAELNERLVHLQGPAKTDETLADPKLNFRQPALRLRRRVETYEWVENKDTHRRNKLGGGEETVTTYKYRTEWVKRHQTSSKFNQPMGHHNPEPRYDNETVNAQRVDLGAFQLSSSLIAGINDWRETPVDFAAISESIPDEEKSRYKPEGKGIYYSPSDTILPPAVGDQRIHFDIVSPCVVSVLAAQRGEKLEHFQTPNGETIESIQVGEVSAAEMFHSLRNMNALLAWVLRGTGWSLATMGFLLILGPLATIASFIPFLENLTGFVTFAISMVLGTIVALITVGVAWLAVRPLLSGVLFALAAIGLFLLFMRRGSTKTVLDPEGSFVN